MAGRDRWCTVELVRAGRVRARCTFGGADPVDLAAIEAIARMALAARRLGYALRLTAVAPELHELLDLAGLGVEVQGEAELAEQPIGLERGEEEAHLRDAPA